MSFEEQELQNEELEQAQVDETTDEVPEQEAETEAYYITPDRDDVYVTVRTQQGEERSLSPREINELYEKVSQYEAQLQIAQQLQQYAPVLNYVANDELSNRVVLYRLQGKSPKEIVEFLYDFYRDMEDNNAQYPQEAGTPDRGVEELKRELGSLKEYIAVQNAVQQNAALLMEQAEQLGLSIDENGNYANVLTDISRELFGDPHYLVRVPINQRQARVVLRELQERIGKKAKPTGAQKPLPPQKKLPKQFPGTAKAGTGAEKTKPERWSLRDAAEVYNQLLGG